MTKRGRRLIPTRWIVDDYGDLTLYRRCSECRSWKPADTEHFYRCHPERDDPQRLTGVCRVCKRAYVVAHRALALKHPETRDEFLARRREARKRWIKAHPDRHREMRNANRRRRYNARAREERAAEARLRNRELAERQGRPITRRASTAVDAWHASGGNDGDRRLDPRPLREWLETVIADERHAEGFGFDHLYRTLGMQDRQVRAIRNGEYRTVSLHVADRLLTGYGRPVVIRSRDLERRLLAWAQGLPGNGTRLLAYLDRAEAVGHLADVAVCSLGDIWPELD